ncbi:MAG: peptide-methionine (S)-S-oxide reductase MsrA [Erysipelotrichaceae bacterium]|jgi:peptide-methionine (S)-S-oxide reductase|nr:peptide-methionine (S)-S-oxide reductase MsrA [Erysipelotrichaceae bacterium]
MKTIYLAGGCFWGIQKYIDQFNGVKETVVGYANGFKENPSYIEVKAGITGHAETCKVVYDESVISLKTLLEKYYLVIDPTSLDKQGEDEGPSYRVGIFYVDEGDLPVIREVTDNEATKYDEPLVIEIEPLKCFYPAEEEHQKYLEKNPEGYCHIDRCFFCEETEK